MPEQTLFTDVALPAGTRQLFTYSVPEGLAAALKPGMRVHVPLANRKVIGMAVRLHDRKPAFRTRPVHAVLDTAPILSEPLLALTEWVHRYYYCAWGEVIQAALPSGLNYLSDRWLLPGAALPPPGSEAACAAIAETGRYPLAEAEKRWGVPLIARLLKNQVLELVEEPRIKVKPLRVKAWTWTPAQSAAGLEYFERSGGKRPGWVSAIPGVMDLKPPVSHRVLTGTYGFSSFMINRIAREGFITPTETEEAFQEAVTLEYEPARIRTLNDTQQAALGQILEASSAGRYHAFLLYGITGSGKTEVYIHALKHVLEQGKGGLVLVPEIALTPQTVRRFYEIFGDQIAVLHSRLSDRQRFEAWRKLESGEKKIAIGARSAVFAPVQRPGIIIVDEEHDTSYRQEEPAPRYHAREVALVRAHAENAVVVLGSATPSLTSLSAVSRGKSTLLRLPARHAEAVLPEVRILDLKHYRSAMRGPLAVPLFLAIEEALTRREQVILLYNRRGFASYLQCEACGDIPECPHCSVSLTYHRSHHALRCHYCGYSRNAGHPHATGGGDCTACGAGTMLRMGSGTQQVEDEVQELFPAARIARMDRDTTAKRDDHERILNRFGRGEADILVGTQLVSKGLDFPNVTVVGVVNADTELAFPSYRSAERMFQMLTQVSGRSGRAGKKGIVFLQTRRPDDPSLLYASKHDYEGFARYEMQNRKMLRYPPYSRIIHFQFKSANQQKTAEAAEQFASILQTVAPGDQVLGPAPSAILRLHNDFRWECYLKTDVTAGTRAVERKLDLVFKAWEREKMEGASTVRINVQVDHLG